MKTQFDETTQRLSEEKATAGQNFNDRLCWRSGRNSTKESLAILARAVEEVSSFDVDDPMDHLHRAIAAVKSRGDWPLEEKP